MAGKGVYSKMFEEVFGADYLAVVSVGDVIRAAHQALENPESASGFMSKLVDVYTGHTPLSVCIDALLSRSTAKLSIPTEFIVALLQLEISRIGKKSLFIDGLPRTPDQLETAKTFKSLIGYADTKEFFIIIDTPEAAIDERIKLRKVCPLCKTSRNLTMLPSKFVGYSPEDDQFYMLCDNDMCSGYNKEILVSKEGDSEGTKLIQERLNNDGNLIDLALNIKDIPLVLLRNSVPVTKAVEYCEEYELTHINKYSYNSSTDSVETTLGKWVFKDDAGMDSYGLLSAPIVVSLISQVHKILLG
jgi:adenylate kinase family enzyme